MDSSRYATAGAVSRFISGVGWLVVAVGAIAAASGLASVQSSPFGLMGVVISLLIVPVGLLLVVAGQANQAVLDTANSSAATAANIATLVEILRGQGATAFQRASAPEAQRVAAPQQVGKSETAAVLSAGGASSEPRLSVQSSVQLVAQRAQLDPAVKLNNYRGYGIIKDPISNLFLTAGGRYMTLEEAADAIDEKIASDERRRNG